LRSANEESRPVGGLVGVATPVAVVGVACSTVGFGWWSGRRAEGAAVSVANAGSRPVEGPVAVVGVACSTVDVALRARRLVSPTQGRDRLKGP
jgi:uncharacterized membrane protein